MLNRGIFHTIPLLLAWTGLLGTAIPQSTHQPTRPTSVLEPKSKRSFPIFLAVPKRAAFHTLAGTGIRTKTLLKVQVYALGLYLDADAAIASLAGWRGRPSKDLGKDSAFYEKLLEDNFGKSLRLVMMRDVSGEYLSEAFTDRLEPRFSRAVKERGLKAGIGDLERFRSYFRHQQLIRETELVFAWLPGGILVSALGGEVLGEIASPALCWALFDLYLGQNPISNKAKTTLIARVPSILAGIEHPLGH